MWWQQFCRSLLPRDAPTRNDIVALNRVWRFQHGECVYCGEPATTSDHFHPLMRGMDGMPSGAGNSVWNRVPACVTCNASKGSRSWREFMTCARGKSPRARGVADWKARMRKLAAFEAEGAARGKPPMDMRPMERALRAARANMERVQHAIRTAHHARSFDCDFTLPKRASRFTVHIPVGKFRTRSYRVLDAAHRSKTPLFISTPSRTGTFLIQIEPDTNAVHVHFAQV